MIKNKQNSFDNKIMKYLRQMRIDGRRNEDRVSFVVTRLGGPMVVEVGQSLVQLGREGVLKPTEVFSRVEGRLGVWAGNDGGDRVEQGILGERLSVEGSGRADDIGSV